MIIMILIVKSSSSWSWLWNHTQRKPMEPRQWWRPDSTTLEERPAIFSLHPLPCEHHHYHSHHHLHNHNVLSIRGSKSISVIIGQFFGGKSFLSRKTSAPTTCIISSPTSTFSSKPPKPIMTLCWSQRENFSGRLQQLVINGERILDEAHLKQLHYEGGDDDDD